MPATGEMRRELIVRCRPPWRVAAAAACPRPARPQQPRLAPEQLDDNGGAAMSNILVLNSSVLGHASVSRVLVEEAVTRLTDLDSGATIVHRDLGAAPIPHLTAATVAGVRGKPVTDSELTARALSNELIAELRNADTIVIGAPMYNFSISTGLRAWFDYVLRPGETFS